MKLTFEPDYRAKVLAMDFSEATLIAAPKDVLAWRSQWLQALKSWHSPYKALINCEKLELANPSPELDKALTTMMTFFKGFFLKKAVGYGYDKAKGHDLLPFVVTGTFQEAAAELGLRDMTTRGGGDSLRSQIQFDNHFRQHVVEMTALSPITFDSDEAVGILKAKLTNNLMQWHSAWSLLIDCSQITFTPASHEEFAKLERFFKGFFLKRVIGYSPKGEKSSYPFPVFRARHRAAAELEGEGNFSGEVANCASRKTP